MINNRSRREVWSLRTNTNINVDEIPKNVLSHLEYDYMPSFKFTSFILTFIAIGLITIVPLLAFQNKWTMYPVVVLIGILIIVTIRIFLTRGENYKSQTTLYMALSGIIGSISYFLTSQQIAYQIGVTSGLYYVVMSLLFLATWVFFLRRQVELSNSEGQRKKKERKSSPFVERLIYIGGPIGYVAMQFLLGHPETIMHLFMCIIYQVLCVIFIYLDAKFVYKYWFMIRNRELVEYFNSAGKKGRIKKD